MSLILAMRAAAILVIASPTAMRPEAGAFTSASGVRSPIANASARLVLKPINVTATSATGTCHGPTIWSRAVMPPTVRSPMLIRKVLLATAGKRNTRSIASRNSMLPVSKTDRCNVSRTTLRVIFGGFPSSTGNGISTGSFLNSASCTLMISSAVALPTTENGHRSRSHSERNSARRSGAIAST